MLESYARKAMVIWLKSSLTGSVYVNGQMVANLAVSGYCVDIDYVSESYNDVSVCPQE